ncbi:ComF family protein [Paenibacillus sp. FSL R7-0297]|uniref:ComF family protein n=1 Tax=Paenibacillus sp. FSL R7-0297 TaxID=2921680 RepID=UPI0030F87B0F
MNSIMSWIKNAQLLIAPTLPQCLFCGKRGRPSSGLPGICVSCHTGIPWIRCPRCQTCGRHVGCPDCSRSREPVPIRCNRSAVAYTNEMRELLGQYKYRGNERLAPTLGLMLDKAYAILQQEQSEVGRNAPLLDISPGKPFSAKSNYLLIHPALWQADLLVPVPVSSARLAERGFNQAEQLADVLSLRRGIPQLPLLIRTRHTGKQSFKSRSERLADMKQVFAGNTDPKILQSLKEQMDSMAPPLQQRPLQIIIIDDIYTTGSTIRACAEALHRLIGDLGYAVELYSLTWARS